MIISSYKDFADDVVLNRLSILDDILNGDQFLVGLSDQAALGDLDQRFNVVKDVVLGFQFCCDTKKPRVYKGEFSSFEPEMGWINNTANCLSGDSGVYLKASDTTYEVQKKVDLQTGYRSIIRARAEELNFAQGWSARPEFSLARNDMTIDVMLERLEVMVEHYFHILTRFAFVADFNKVSMCTVFIEQLQCGGMPCGWLSKKPYWDLIEWSARENRPELSMEEGVFSDPRDHLAMLHLGT